MSLSLLGMIRAWIARIASAGVFFFYTSIHTFTITIVPTRAVCDAGDDPAYGIQQKFSYGTTEKDKMPF